MKNSLLKIRMTSARAAWATEDMQDVIAKLLLFLSLIWPEYFMNIYIFVILSPAINPVD